MNEEVSGQNREDRLKQLEAKVLKDHYMFRLIGSENGMSHALKDQLHLVKPDTTPTELEDDLISYLKEHEILSDGTKLRKYVNSSETWSDYIGKMKQQNDWEDHLILQACANLYKQPITVISDLPGYETTRIVPVLDRQDGSSSAQGGELVLGHVAKNHYISLIKVDENHRRLIEMEKVPATDPTLKQHHDDLREKANKKGYAFLPNKLENNNCMFDALADQLQSTENIRVTLVEYLKTEQARKELEKFSIYPERPWQEYLDEMSKDETWGDRLILQAFANYHKRPLRVISSLSSYEETLVMPVPEPDHQVEPLVLGHVVKGHYVSLIRVHERLRRFIDMRRKASETSVKHLEETVGKSGYLFYPIDLNNGDCMFHALESQLQFVNRRVPDQGLRAELVTEVSAMLKAYDSKLRKLIDGYESVEEYLVEMKKDGTWGDHLVLQAFANRYKLPVKVISGLPTYKETLIVPVPGPDEHVEPLVLGYVPRDYYVCLIKGPAGMAYEDEESRDVYLKSLKEDPVWITRVPIMIIGQEGAGKTSLKRSLKGEEFKEVPSTEGIDIDADLVMVSLKSFQDGTACFSKEAMPKEAAPVDLASKFSDLKNILDTATKLTTDNNRQTDDHRQTRTPELERKHEAPSKQTQTAVDSGEEASQQVPKKDQVSTPSVGKSKKQEDKQKDDSKNQDNVSKKQDGDIFCTIWDFAGQAEYYGTHALFLIREAIYLLIYNLSEKPDKETVGLIHNCPDQMMKEKLAKTNEGFLHFWMRSISIVSAEDKTKSALPETILVCTHADNPYAQEGKKLGDAEKLEEAKRRGKDIYDSLRVQPYGKHLSDKCYVVSNKDYQRGKGGEFKGLLEKIMKIAPEFSKQVPRNWFTYEKALQLAVKEGFHVMKFSDAKRIASEVCGITDEENVKVLLKSLHYQRTVIYFRGPDDDNALVVLNPQWLIDIFKKIIGPEDRIKKGKAWETLKEKGVLKRELLQDVWMEHLEENTIEAMASIMEKCALFCRWPETTSEDYLVPHMMKVRHDFDNLKSMVPSLFVHFEPLLNPVVIFPHFLVCLMQVWNEKCHQEKQLRLSEDSHLYRNCARLYFGSAELSVRLLCKGSTIQVTLITPGNASDATVREICTKVYNFLLHALERLQFPFKWLCERKMKLSVLCTVCHGNERDGIEKQRQDATSLRKGQQDPIFWLLHGCKTHDPTQEYCNDGCIHFYSKDDLLAEQVQCKRPPSAPTQRVDKESISHWFPKGNDYNEPGEEEEETKQVAYESSPAEGGNDSDSLKEDVHSSETDVTDTAGGNANATGGEVPSTGTFTPNDIPDCRVSEIPFALKSYLFLELDLKKSYVANWRDVGKAFKLTTDQSKGLEIVYQQRDSPTQSLFTILETRGSDEPSLKDLVKVLIELQRSDIVDNWDWKANKRIKK